MPLVPTYDSAAKKLLGNCSLHGQVPLLRIGTVVAVERTILRGRVAVVERRVDVLRVAHRARRNSGVEVNDGNLQAAASGFADVEVLVKAFEAHAAVPPRVECLAVVDAISRADHGFGIDGVGKSDTRRNRRLEGSFGIVLAVAGRSPLCAGKGEPSGSAACSGVCSKRVDEGEVVVLLLERGDVVPAQTVVERELGGKAPHVTAVCRVGVLAGVFGVHVAVIGSGVPDRSEVEAGHGVAWARSGRRTTQISRGVGIEGERAALIAGHVDGCAGQMVLKSGLERVPAKDAGEYVIEGVGASGCGVRSSVFRCCPTGNRSC